jgi:hypothetical protein
MLARLDVATGWKPQARTPVIDEQDVIAIHDREIGHKVLRRDCGPGDATDVCAGVEPGKRIGQVIALECITRIDARHFGADLVSHGSEIVTAFGGEGSPGARYKRERERPPVIG